MSYNNLNDLSEQIDAKGQRIAFTYDKLQRVTKKKVYSAGQSNWDYQITYSYDDTSPNGSSNLGRLTKAVLSGGHRVDYSHENGQLVKEVHEIDGVAYELKTNYDDSGFITGYDLPTTPGSNTSVSTGTMRFDAANRLIGYDSPNINEPDYINNVIYDIWDNPTTTSYMGDITDNRWHHPQRGWLNDIGIKKNAQSLSYTTYTRDASGRITAVRTTEPEGRFDYTYDYAGRLLEADNVETAHSALDQTFTYDSDGRIRSNSHVGIYNYGALTPTHAPSTIVNGGATTTFTYDANGNMLTGLDGKSMTYDAENRPLSVVHNGVTTIYVYGADGTRIKKIENAGTPNEVVTAYLGMVEIQKFGQGTNEVVIAYPHPSVRLVDGEPEILHADNLNSIRAITDENGNLDKSASYKPFGEADETLHDLAAKPESKGFIGERYDMDSGLQFLNARYYDPALGMFIQPDWLEVTRPGVGTNRYSYSYNDPINLSDPSGNGLFEAVTGKKFSETKLGSFLGDVGKHVSDSFSGDRQRSLNAAGYNASRFDGGYRDFLGLYDVLPAGLSIFESDCTCPTVIPKQFTPEDLAKAAGVTVVVGALAFDPHRKTYVTYTLLNPLTGKIYSGRTSGTGLPEFLATARFQYHHAKLRGFSVFLGVDRAIQQVGGRTHAYQAIRGREQNLIDFHGGAISDLASRQQSGNLIRGVSRVNPARRDYHDAAFASFGYKAPY